MMGQQNNRNTGEQTKNKENARADMPEDAREISVWSMEVLKTYRLSMKLWCHHHHHHHHHQERKKEIVTG